MRKQKNAGQIRSALEGERGDEKDMGDLKLCSRVIWQAVRNL